MCAWMKTGANTGWGRCMSMRGLVYVCYSKSLRGAERPRVLHEFQHHGTAVSWRGKKKQTLHIKQRNKKRNRWCEGRGGGTRKDTMKKNHVDQRIRYSSAKIKWIQNLYLTDTLVSVEVNVPHPCSHSCVSWEERIPPLGACCGLKTYKKKNNNRRTYNDSVPLLWRRPEVAAIQFVLRRQR